MRSISPDWPPRVPYYIAMPTIATAGGFDQVVARLRVVLNKIRTLSGGQPLCVIAHSTTGMAARVVAAQPGLSHLVTFGTPHSGTTFGWLDRPATADAIRAMQSPSTLCRAGRTCHRRPAQHAQVRPRRGSRQS